MWIGSRRRMMEVALSAGVGLTVSGCVGGSRTSTASANGSSVIEEVAVADRVELPRFSGETLQDGPFDTADFRGRVLVINVWGSWCVPCRAEAPALRQASEDFRAQGVQFVGINVRDNNDAAIAFERSYGITYPSITTADSGPPMLAVGKVVPRSAVPSTVVVDPKGNVAARIIGAGTYVTFKNIISSVLAESAPQSPSRLTSAEARSQSPS